MFTFSCAQFVVCFCILPAKLRVGLLLKVATTVMSKVIPGPGGVKLLVAVQGELTCSAKLDASPFRSIIFLR